MKVSDASPDHLSEGFHIVLTTLAMQHELDIDLGSLLLRIDAATVDKMCCMDLTKTFCGSELNTVIFGSCNAHAFHHIFRGSRGIPLQVCINQRYIRKRSRSRDSMNRVCNKPSHQRRFLNRSLDIPTGQKSGIAASHSL